jgi:hypothetical protein
VFADLADLAGSAFPWLTTRNHSGPGCVILRCVGA